MKQEDLQAIADLTADALDIPAPTLSLRDVRRGTARTRRGYFTLPEWALTKGETYTTYYIVHEVCHFFGGFLSHGLHFRQVEDRALSLWDIQIERKKVYPSKLFCNGQLEYIRKSA